MATQSLAVLAPSAGSSGTGDLTASNVTAGGTWNAFTLNITGSDVSNEAYSLSFNTSSGDFVIDVNSTQLIGGTAYPNSSKIDFTYPQVITVGRRHADFYTLYDAINSILDNSSDKK